MAATPYLQMNPKAAMGGSFFGGGAFDPVANTVNTQNQQRAVFDADPAARNRLLEMGRNLGLWGAGDPFPGIGNMFLADQVMTILDPSRKEGGLGHALKTFLPIALGIAAPALMGAGGLFGGATAGGSGAASAGAAAMEAAQLAEMGFTAAEMASLGLSQEAIAAGLSAAGSLSGSSGWTSLLGDAGTDTLGGISTSGFDISDLWSLMQPGGVASDIGSLPALSGAGITGEAALGGAALPLGAASAAGGIGMSFLDDLLGNVFSNILPTKQSIIPSLLQAGVSLYSGSQQADAARDAASQQQIGALMGQQELARQFNINQANLQPWLRGGRQGLTELFQMLGIPYDPVTGQPMALQSPDDILRKDPEYQFQLAEGMKALERSAAARTGTLNPAAVKALERYSQGVASNTYTNRYNRLASLAGLGQTTAQQMGAFGANYATNTANLIGQGANAGAAGTVGAANAQASGLEGAAGAFSTWNQNRMLADLLGSMSRPTYSFT